MDKAYRTESQRQLDIDYIEKLYLSGVTSLRKIAAKLNARKGIGYTVSHETVRHDLKLLHQKLESTQETNITHSRNLMLAKYRQMQAMAIGEWHASKKTKTITKLVVGGKDGDIQTTINEERNGNPAYLNIALAAMGKEAQLLGLNNTLYAANENDELLGGAIPKDLSKLTENELAELEKSIGHIQEIIGGQPPSDSLGAS